MQGGSDKSTVLDLLLAKIDYNRNFIIDGQRFKHFKIIVEKIKALGKSKNTLAIKNYLLNQQWKMEKSIEHRKNETFFVWLQCCLHSKEHKVKLALFNTRKSKLAIEKAKTAGLTACKEMYKKTEALVNDLNEEYNLLYGQSFSSVHNQIMQKEVGNKVPTEKATISKKVIRDVSKCIENKWNKTSVSRYVGWLYVMSIVIFMEINKLYFIILYKMCMADEAWPWLIIGQFPSDVG